MYSEKRIRIVFISDASYVGGAEKYVELLMLGLDRERYEPVLVTPDRGELEGLRNSVVESGMESLTTPERSLSSAAGAGRLRAMLKRLGPDIVHVNMPGPFDCFYGLPAAVAALAGIRRIVTTEHLPMVELAGQFARRGGVFDLWPFALPQPVRLEFFGDRIERMRFFDPVTQRSTGELEALDVSTAAVRGDEPTSPDQVSLLSHLPADSVLVFEGAESAQERAASYLARLADPRGTFSFEGLWRAAGRFSRLLVNPLPVPEGDGAVNFRVGSVERFGGDVAAVKRELEDLCRRHRVVVFCDNAAEAQRLEELLADTSLTRGGRFETEVGPLSRGFRLDEMNLLLVPNRELFQRYADRRPVKPRRRGRPIESFLELARGDYVVHVAHGIARFVGMELIQRDGTREECLVLEFADRVRVYVPASRIELVQKYVGGFERYPKLSRLGTAAWERSKRTVKEAVTDLAAEMIRLQAVRASQPGIAYPEDTAWQREFEASFIYAETPDQLEALAAIKQDMQSRKPMDRLLCGDVGYGKTELAIRAAFKAVEAGKQVAVLCPTTVLALQHMERFSERFQTEGDWAIHVMTADARPEQVWTKKGLRQC